MSLDSPKGVSFPSLRRGGLLDRPDPVQNRSLSDLQSEVDQLVRNAVATISDGKTMASLLGAGLVGKLVRLGTVAAAGESLAPLLVRGASYATALAGESAAFAGMERGFGFLE